MLAGRSASDLDPTASRRSGSDAWGGYLCQPSLSPIPGNDAQLLSDGREALPRMLGAIEGAAHSISVEMYRFASDLVGHRFARTLADAARRGVEVRVLVDAAGCRDSPRTFFGWMRARGIDVRGVNPLRHLLRRSFLSVGWRDHRKLILIDDDSAFVGGLNLSREGAERSEGGCGWHDAVVLLRGPVVAGLSGSFERSWSDEHRLRRPALRPLTVPQAAGKIPALILESVAAGRGPFGGALRYAVRHARRTVWIANPYFLPPHSLRRALSRAAHRGVDVRILVPRSSDCPLALWASQRWYSSYLRSGLRLFEWPGEMMHAKVAVVDGLWSTIGSYNIDPLSLLRNRELNVALLGPDAGASFERLLERDFSRSGEIESGAWGLRGTLRRWKERLSSGFRGLL